MAAAKNNKKPRVGWFTRIRAILATFIAFTPVFKAVQEQGFSFRALQVIGSNYTGLDPFTNAWDSFSPGRLATGYVPIAGAYAFYKGTGVLAKQVSRGLAA